MKFTKELEPYTEAAARIFVERASTTHEVVNAFVYGSRARGTHREDSDVDLAIILAGQREDFWRVNMAMADLASDLLLETGMNISPLPVWQDEWEHPQSYINPKLLKNIQREGFALFTQSTPKGRRTA